MARILNPQDLQAHLPKLISAKKQISHLAIDLTVQKIFRVRKCGQVDFGGSEFQPAEWKPLPPVKDNPDAAYGWWELGNDVYLIQFNETLQLGDREVGLIQAHPRLIETGCMLAPQLVKALRTELLLPMVAPKSGVRIKENARIAQFIVLELDDIPG